MSNYLDILRDYGADIDGVMDRFMDDEELLADCLVEFMGEDQLLKLRAAIESKDYEESFEVAHALKGVSGNLGLTPLFDKVCVLVESLRAKDYGPVENEFSDVCDAYDKFVTVYESLGLE